MKRFFYLYKAAYSGLPREAWMLSFVVLVNRSGSMVLFFMTLYLTSEQNFSVAQAGRMISIFGLGSLVGSFLGGWLSDIWGTRRVQTFSLIGSAAGYIILAYLNTPAAIAVMLFIVAIISESFRPANATALANACPPEIRARGFALHRLAANLGLTIGPALGGYLATVNYTYLFWVDGITCLGAGLLLWISFHHWHAMESAKFDSTLHPVQRSPWRDGVFFTVLSLVFISALVFVQIFNSWPIYLKGIYLLLENQIGSLLALNALMIVFIEMPLIHRIERKLPLRIMALGALLLFGGFAILPLGNSYVYAAFTVIIWTLGEILLFPLMATFIANRAADQNRGKYMGMYTFTFALAFVVGPALGTWIYETHSPTILWMNCGFLGLLTSAGFWWLQRVRKMNV